MTFWREATPPEEGLAARGSYVLERCRACGTAAVAAGQRHGESGELYEAGAYGSGPMRLERVVTAYRGLVVGERLRFLRGLRTGARVLEVGCGDGRLLVALAGRGYAVRGIEPARGRASAARTRGIAVEAVPVDEARVPPGSQDAVVLWHVLEHMDDPGHALDLVRGWLAPRGRVVVAVPNLASLQARLGGDRWFHQDVPRHLTHFTAAGLAALLERSGFRIEETRQLLFEHNALGMWQTLLNRLTTQRNTVQVFVKRSARHGTRASAARDAAVVALFGPLLILPATALELVAGLAGRGGTIVVEARRA